LRFDLIGTACGVSSRRCVHMQDDSTRPRPHASAAVTTRVAKRGSFAPTAPIDAGQIGGAPHGQRAHGCELFLLRPSYDDAELDRKEKRLRCSRASSNTRMRTRKSRLAWARLRRPMTAAATVSLEASPGHAAVLLPEGRREVPPAPPMLVAAMRRLQLFGHCYRSRPSLGLALPSGPRGDVRPSELSSLRAELVRVPPEALKQLQHRCCRTSALPAGFGTLAGKRRCSRTHWICQTLLGRSPAQLSRASNWDPARWDWVDPLEGHPGAGFRRWEAGSSRRARLLRADGLRRRGN